MFEKDDAKTIMLSNPSEVNRQELTLKQRKRNR